MAADFAHDHDLPVSDRRPPLTVEQILVWAEAHQLVLGQWPTPASGPVRQHPFTETWRAIDGALVAGQRGMRGGQTLAGLIRAHRGLFEPGPSAEAMPVGAKPLQRVTAGRAQRRKPSLTVAQILRWADAHHRARGRWPNGHSGPVKGAASESWNNIAQTLRTGGRGLPGGSSLARLLDEHRGVRDRTALPDLSVERVLAWADAHRAATGNWPTASSGPVQDAPGEQWRAVNYALKRGTRGLPGGSSLARLLDDHRPAGRSTPTPEMVLAWTLENRGGGG